MTPTHTPSEGPTGSTPIPHNIDAEMSVLGAMLESREAVANVIGILKPDDFYKPVHVEIFDTILALYDKGEVPDAVTLAEELQQRGTLEVIGGKPYIFALLTAYPTAAAAADYARIVRDHAERRSVIGVAEQIKAAASNGAGDVDLASLIADLKAPAPDDGELELRPQPMDLGHIDTEEQEPQKFVVDDLIAHRSVLLLTGEEGEGKTLMAEQIVRQIARGETVLGMFEPGELVPKKILMVDTEMEEPEVRHRSTEIVERGLAVEPGRVHWVCAGGLLLDNSDQDRAYIESLIGREGYDFVWIDAGSNALSDPKDDIPVKNLFNWLSRLMRTHGIIAAGLTTHPRKRAQGDFSRRFDDLFSSREWKGRPTKALYMDGGKIVAWKDRGWHLHRRWPGRLGGRYAMATLLKPGLDDPTVPPFEIVCTPDGEVPLLDEEVAEMTVLELLRSEPDRHSMTAVANHLGGRKKEALALVKRMIAEGTIGPETPRAKLRVIDDAEEGSHDPEPML